MVPRFAWVLNLDADLELGSTGSYTPTRRTLAALRPWRDRVRATLLREGDVVVDEATPPGHAKGMLGRGFCPTPYALSLLERAGAIAEPSPPRDVLARVNGRAFCDALGPTLPGGVFVADERDALAVLASRPPAGARAWRAKRAFGMAGRGQRVLAPSPSPGEFRRDDAAFVRGSFPGGLRIEPDVEIEAEYARHGILDEAGVVRLGAVVRQRCDARGGWVETTRLSDAERAAIPFAASLEASARRVAEALAAAGYFGPFGVDAFAFRTAGDPTIRWNARSEINARYSMGFGVGFASSG